MDVAGLIVNICLLFATGVAAGVAWWQAAAARRASATAEAAQRETLALQQAAVKAQEAAAAHLAEANSTAQGNLDLQSRIDARASEFRRVTWDAGWEYDQNNELVFQVRNSGLTDAEQVTVVVMRPDLIRTSGSLGTIRAGESASHRIEHAPETDPIELMLFRDTPYEVHWVSPLGHPETYQYRKLEP